MIRARLALAIGALALGLSAGPAQAATIYATTGTGDLISFDSSAPSVVTDLGGLSVPAGETIVGMDSRTANGDLMLLTRDAGGVGRLYVVEPVGSQLLGPVVLSADPVDAASPYTTLPSGAYGADFNPTVDRLRLVHSGLANMRVRPDSGLVITDTTLNTAPGYTPTFLTLAGAAYTNNFPGSTITLLYGYNFLDNDIVTIPTPNGGTVNFLGEPGIVASTAARLQMDIAPNGTGYLAALVGTDNLYTVDLTTGAATLVGAIGAGSLDIRSMAASTENLVQLGSSATTAAENGGAATLFVTRSNPTGTTTVDVATADGSAVAGSDYEATSQTLTFTQGEVVKQLTMNVTDDASRRARRAVHGHPLERDLARRAAEPCRARACRSPTTSRVRPLLPTATATAWPMRWTTPELSNATRWIATPTASAPPATWESPPRSRPVPARTRSAVPQATTLCRERTPATGWWAWAETTAWRACGATTAWRVATARTSSAAARARTSSPAAAATTAYRGLGKRHDQHRQGQEHRLRRHRQRQGEREEPQARRGGLRQGQGHRDRRPLGPPEGLRDHQALTVRAPG